MRTANDPAIPATSLRTEKASKSAWISPTPDHPERSTIAWASLRASCCGR